MQYSEVNFICEGGELWHRDLLIDELGRLGYDTFEEHERGFSAYIPSQQFDFQALETLLLTQPAEFNVQYKVTEIAPENWNAVWESNFEPISIGSCHVRATFHPAQRDYEYEIVIEPKMAFGTGHHQTTSLMLEYLLEEVDISGRSVLDMGCGTGILAILASMRGAKEVLAIDNDPVCVSSVEENSKLNKRNNINFALGSDNLLKNHSFDIILANINRNILLDQMENYFSVLKSGGKLYLSGFYESEDLSLIKQAASDIGLFYIGHKVKDMWVAARFDKQI